MSQLYLVAGIAANKNRQQPAGESRTHRRVTWSVVVGIGREGSGGREAGDLKNLKKETKKESRTELVSIWPLSLLGRLLRYVPSFPLSKHSHLSTLQPNRSTPSMFSSGRAGRMSGSSSRGQWLSCVSTT